MGLWGKPNIAKLIARRDAEGLRKACLQDDYYVRKDAILGLVSINELLPRFCLILTLVNDSDYETRKLAYTYGLVGELGLFSLVAAIHDTDKSIRVQALSQLNVYHKKRVLQIFERVALLDPDDQVRRLAESFLDPTEQSNRIGNKVFINNGEEKWLSDTRLMVDFLDLVKKDDNWKPMYRCRDGGFTGPYQSALMHSCKTRFAEAKAYLETDRKRAITLLYTVFMHASEGEQYMAKVPLTEVAKYGPLPYQDYVFCSTIMLTRLGYFGP